MAEITIGMPLYNNARTLTVALDSLLSQTVRDVRIIISDDCSSDGTGFICEEFARRDERVTYVRQPKNLGYHNFRFVLQQASTPFFMWAAGDDRWTPTFIEENLRALKADRSLVASVSRVCFERDGRPVRAGGGTYPLLGTVTDNIARFLRDPNDNSRMYGVFRTEILKKCFPSRSFHAYDWALSAATLLHGKHNEIPEILMFRDLTLPSSYSALVRSDHSALVPRLFPLLHMTRWLVFHAKIPLTWRIVGALFALNVDKHYAYCERFHPLYYKSTASIQRFWRHYVRHRF